MTTVDELAAAWRAATGADGVLDVDAFLAAVIAALRSGTTNVDVVEYSGVGFAISVLLDDAAIDDAPNVRANLERVAQRVNSCFVGSAASTSSGGMRSGELTLGDDTVEIEGRWDERQVALYRADSVDHVIAMRHRRQVIWTLGLIADAQAQCEYQAKAPVNVSYELFELWNDWFLPDWAGLHATFAKDEWAALLAFHAVIGSVAERTPRELPYVEEFQRDPQWARLNAAAAEALAALRRPA